MLKVIYDIIFTKYIPFGGTFQTVLREARGHSSYPQPTEPEIQYLVMWCHYTQRCWDHQSSFSGAGRWRHEVSELHSCQACTTTLIAFPQLPNYSLLIGKSCRKSTTLSLKDLRFLLGNSIITFILLGKVAATPPVTCLTTSHHIRSQLAAQGHFPQVWLLPRRSWPHL